MCWSNVVEMINISVKEGEVFEIPLQAMPSTGYVWSLVSVPEGLQLLESSTDAGGAQRPGDPITQVFHVKALHAGNYLLQFLHGRKWENTHTEDREFQVVVK